MSKQPTPVANIDQAAAIAFSGTRSRPVVAFNGKQMIVCCSRTARKHGWKIEGKLF